MKYRLFEEGRINETLCTNYVEIPFASKLIDDRSERFITLFVYRVKIKKKSVRN